MTTSFPTGLDTFTNPNAAGGDTLASVPHDSQHANINDSVAAIEVKLGVNSSTVTTTIDYLLKNTSSLNPGHKHSEAGLSLTDVTTNNVSTTQHGFAPKLPNDATKYLDGTGAYSIPAGGGSPAFSSITAGTNTTAAMLVGTGGSLGVSGSGTITATTLATARTIGGVSFDGSANITVATATAGFTVSGGDLAIGANNISCTGSLGSTGSRLTKGWFTDLQVTNAIAGSVTGNAGTVSNATLTTALTVNTGTVTLAGNAANTSVLTIGAGAVSISGANTGDQTSVSGNAGTATALATGRTIAITGDLAYTSPSFDGSGNVTAAGTLATVNSNVGSFGSATASVAITVNGKGLVTAASSSTITPAESSVTFTDITTGNVTSTKHGYAPKSPADATQFLNGATTPAYAAVKDSDLSTTDITTNNVSTSKHGFAPKLPNDATKYLDGTGAYSVPAGGGGGGSGGGMFTYSDNGLTLTAGTYYAPIGGGGIPVTTEANVSVPSPSATTVTNLQVSLSVAPGVGQTMAVTLRKNGSDTALTCTISGASTSAQDLTHSVNVAQGDTIDWKIVTTGTYVSTPTVNISANNGTSSVGVTNVSAGAGTSFTAITTTGSVALKSYVLAQSSLGWTHTGDTTETTLVDYTLPANTLPANGRLRISTIWSRTSANNTVTQRIRFSTISGTILQTSAQSTTQLTSNLILDLWANNATNAQQFYNPSGQIYANSTNAISTAAVDTTADTHIVFTTQCTNGSDTGKLLAYTIELLQP